MKCLLLKAVSGFYYLETADGIIEAKARGALKNAGISPAAGDTVDVVIENGGYVIESVCERKNYIVRPPLANLDNLFIVSSQSTPLPSALLIDKMIAVAELKNINPILIFNKSDLGDFDDSLISAYTKAGIVCYIVSCANNKGVDCIKKELNGKISAFVGNSGVGKSSLLNLLFGNDRQKIGDVSQKLGRGKHTTRNVELIPIDKNTYVADTPGFSTFDLQAYETVFKEDLVNCFREFEPYYCNCKFTSCTHTSELGCAVIDAVNNGVIGRSRHESYVTMYNDIKDLHKWQLKK